MNSIMCVINGTMHSTFDEERVGRIKTAATKLPLSTSSIPNTYMVEREN